MKRSNFTYKQPKGVNECLAVIRKIRNLSGCHDFVITGSLALKILGFLPDDYTIKDLDLVYYNPDRKESKRLQDFFSTQHQHHYSDDYDDSSYEGDSDLNPIKVENRGRTWLVDIWVREIEEDQEEPLLEYKGFKMHHPIHIINEKAAYNRNKDLRQLILIQQTISNKIADALARTVVRTYDLGKCEKRIDWSKFNEADNDLPF